MGLFGGREKKRVAAAAMKAEQERLSALTLSDLATEVMERGFGPGGPGAVQEIKVNALFDLYAPVGSASGDMTPRLTIENLLREAVQALERGGLVVSSGGGDTSTLYRKTRAGQDALDAGAVAAALRDTQAQ